ncbi:hypothetical protein DM860_008494 [Cuscuta australis]|uniref:Transmembrane protein n=1 Tax=Cuscuta australis TaxID=267555 RepID=A0A328D5I4_9ASTE|nr:hypothetical protein DM860_008494 [Cuscuta australis]
MARRKKKERKKRNKEWDGRCSVQLPISPSVYRNPTLRFPKSSLLNCPLFSSHYAAYSPFAPFAARRPTMSRASILTPQLLYPSSPSLTCFYSAFFFIYQVYSLCPVFISSTSCSSFLSFRDRRSSPIDSII